MSKQITIAKAGVAYLIEPGLLGFAGGTMTGFWQTAVAFESSDGIVAGSYGTQNPLWCYKPLYVELQKRLDKERGEVHANELMQQVTEHAVNLLRGRSFKRADLFLKEILPKVHEYAKNVTNDPNLPLTFTLNALVPVDNACWILYAKTNGIINFFDMLPSDYQPCLNNKVDCVAIIPLISYPLGEEKIRELIRAGYRVGKTKMGAYDDKFERGSDADMEAMFETDTKKALLVAKLTEGITDTPITIDGRVPLYLDFNGRCGSGEKGVAMLTRNLEYASEKGYGDRIMVVEEPFGDMLSQRDYSTLNKKFKTTIVADECAHSAEEVRKLLELGVRGFALKPAAKTLSMSLEMIMEIDKHNATAIDDDKAYYFCADLTVVPWLVENCNLQVTARSAPWPGLSENFRMLESNWLQHYERRDILQKLYPASSVVDYNTGIFELTDDWFKYGGKLFDVSGPLFEEAKRNMR